MRVCRLMTEYSPQALWDCYYTVAAAIPSAVMSGIIGDSGHTYGYHRGRNYLSSSDYSCQYSADLGGSGEAANGLDISFSSADMKTVTRRLIDAVDRGDSRIQTLREFYGTVDGWSVTGRDIPTGSWITSDDSHLWHVHLSGFRENADDTAAWQGVADIIIGQQREAEDLTPEEHNWLNNVYSGMFLNKGSSLPHGASLITMVDKVYEAAILTNKAAPGGRPFTSTEANAYAALLAGGPDMPDGKSLAQLVGELNTKVDALCAMYGIDVMLRGRKQDDDEPVPPIERKPDVRTDVPPGHWERPLYRDTGKIDHDRDPMTYPRRDEAHDDSDPTDATSDVDKTSAASVGEKRPRWWR